MWSQATTIAQGDLVIVCSRTGKGFIYLLRPTPELWTLALPHRTQILYIADIALIVSWLNITSGSRVIEAVSTGSGSFSHSVARTIGSSGHLYSYEFHEARANKAREEFTAHGMSSTVTLTHRNVCKMGFTVENEVDAVFLDLPAPWDAVDHAKKALRKDRITRICCFSPCMEQVLRTVSTLNDAGFTEITMYETLLRPHEITSVPPPLPVSQISTKLKAAERRREDKRLIQIAANKARSAAAGNNAAKRKREPSEEDTGKRVKIVSKEEEETIVKAQDVEETDPIDAGEDEELEQQHSEEEKNISVSRALPEVRGHTSYLTFACLVPFFLDDDSTTPTTIEEKMDIS
ncbi:1-methyladenosine methyltransferase catalytic subunit Gcd14 [Cyathus striatus]|nr:1-methyladenosine methyltransferase catalytic subunit Gcd14 [Cyathus striatus]